MQKMKIVLSFPPSQVENPIIYQLIMEHGLMVNILRASIDPRKQGRMVVELTGDEARLSQGLNHLELSGIGVEPHAGDVHHVTSQCAGCTACVPICPTGAFEIDPESWMVTHDTGKCVACLSCVDACPYRAIEAYAR